MALKPLKNADYKKLMSLSDNLSDNCVEMFQAYSTGKEVGKSAGGLFDGPAYKSLDCKSLNEIEMERCQNHIRFLSGFYGILKPCDVIQNHRLEMGTKGLPLPDESKSLYEYWGTHVAKVINDHFNAAASTSSAPGILLNCASEEYFKVVDKSKLDEDRIKIVNCVFQDNGKIVSVYAKRARGLMSRFVVTNENVNRAIEENNISNIMEALKQFDLENYEYVHQKSTESTLVFNRTKPPLKKDSPKSENMTGKKRKAS